MHSSTETWREATADLRHVLRFRGQTVRRRGAAVAGLLLVLGLTVAFATSPAGWDGQGSGSFSDLVDGLPEGLRGSLGVGYASCLLLGIATSMGAGGGRELLSRSELAIHPVGPRAEHLGSLALSTVNLAWLIQLWALLAATALVAPPGRLLGAQVVAVLWVLAATAIAQVVGWCVEGVRRLEHGVVAVRLALGLVASGIVALQLSGRLLDVGRALPTTWIVEQSLTARWEVAAAVAAATAVAAGWLGARPARWALGLPPREELKADSGVHEARHLPRPRLVSLELALLVRLDRGSVWRSVGMRRGLIVLGLGPGLIALVTPMQWGTVLMLPGLAASGSALLFAVNAWCLDGRGMVWRESLPVPATVTWAARAWVIAESMVVVSGITVVVAALRAGLPSPAMGAAVLACWLVVLVQVLAVTMSWSVRNPFSVDLSSPRATPAPHAVMAGYAGRLSLSTTMTALLFAGLAAIEIWWLPLAVAPVFLLWSLLRLKRARTRWLSPPVRARVALTVAAV